MAMEIVTQEKQDQGDAEKTLAALRKIKGMEYVYNRLPKKFEKMYDGQVYVFEPHEIRPLLEPVANWFWAHSVISYEPVTGVEVRALVTTQDKLFGVSYDEPIGPELLDRSMAETVNVDGLRLKQQIVAVKGGGYEAGKKIEADTTRV